MGLEGVFVELGESDVTDDWRARCWAERKAFNAFSYGFKLRGVREKLARGKELTHISIPHGFLSHQSTLLPRTTSRRFSYETRLANMPRFILVPLIYERSITQKSERIEPKSSAKTKDGKVPKWL